MQNYKRVLLKESKILDVWFGCWFAVDERCGVWCGLRLTGLGPGLPCLGGPLDEEVMPGATGELLRRVYAGSRTWVGADTSWKPSISPTTEPELCLADLEIWKYQDWKRFTCMLAHGSRSGRWWITAHLHNTRTSTPLQNSLPPPKKNRLIG